MQILDESSNFPVTHDKFLRNDGDKRRLIAFLCNAIQEQSIDIIQSEEDVDIINTEEKITIIGEGNLRKDYHPFKRY